MNQAPLPQDRFEALEAYVLGRMDAAQRQRIEMDLAADADLNSELALQREHIRAVEMAGVERQLNLLARQQPDRIRSTATGWHSWLKYAALVAVLPVADLDDGALRFVARGADASGAVTPGNTP